MVSVGRLAAVETRLDRRSGMFWMVPRWVVVDDDEARVTRVPGGNGSALGSVRFQYRPHVRPPSYLMDFG